MNLTDLDCISENTNLDKYISFRESVKSKMKHPEWLGDFNKKELEKLLSNGSKIWMYYLNDIPVCSMMLIPADEYALQKFDLNLNYHEVADYGPMFVYCDYLGNKLQYQMLKMLDKYCVKNGYKYAISTIHPDNIYSIKNFADDNFKLQCAKNFTRGIRNVYLKDLNEHYGKITNNYYALQKIDIEKLLDSLSKSKFRGSFHLNNKMKKYTREKGIDKIESDAKDLITKRVASSKPKNDGKQTPMRQVHPVFIAQHATGTCCRDCLEKIHHIKKGHELSEDEINYVVKVIMTWIEREIKE